MDSNLLHTSYNQFVKLVNLRSMMNESIQTASALPPARGSDEVQHVKQEMCALHLQPHQEVLRQEQVVSD